MVSSVGPGAGVGGDAGEVVRTVQRFYLGFGLVFVTVESRR